MGDVLWSCEAAYFHTKPALTEPVSIEGLLQRPLFLPYLGLGKNNHLRCQPRERAQTIGMPFIPDIEVETGAAALAIAASVTAPAWPQSRLSEALGYTSRLNYVSLDPPLIETFAIISRDPASLSPATQAMIKLAEEHMRMLHREYQPT